MFDKLEEIEKKYVDLTEKISSIANIFIFVSGNFIFIYTNTQVDFARAVVGTKQIGQAQNWVGRSGSNVLKHDEVPL